MVCPMRCLQVCHMGCLQMPPRDRGARVLLVCLVCQLSQMGLVPVVPRGDLVGIGVNTMTVARLQVVWLLVNLNLNLLD